MLRTSVSFERKTRTSDGAGGYTEAWATISGAPTKCAFKALSGGERWASQRVEATTSARLTVRYSSAIQENDRAVIDGRAYNIRFLNNVEMRDKWLVIDVSGGVAT